MFLSVIIPVRNGGDDFRHCLEALAAAHANAGDFDQAVAYQSKVLEMAPPDAEGAARRLELYRNRRPYRRELQQPSPAAR